MGRLSFHVAGESHGPGLLVIIYGLPARVPVIPSVIERWLLLRRKVSGRGQRMALEEEPFEILSGVKGGRTNGGPLSMFIRNVDCSGESREGTGKEATGIEFPRPGHGDLAGALKWGLTDATTVAEICSARVTAAYTAVGAVCATLLEELGVQTLAHVLSLGKVKAATRRWLGKMDLREACRLAESSSFLVCDPSCETAMEEEIRSAWEAGDTLGGVFEVVASPLPAGLGAPQPLERRLDARLAGLLMGIPGVRAVAIGAGFGAGGKRGSKFHDGIYYTPARGFYRRTNRGGGLEGGMTNGEPLVVQGVMKPVPTLRTPLASASLVDHREGKGARIRSDVAAVAACAMVARSLVAFVLADEAITHSGGDIFDAIVEKWRS